MSINKEKNCDVTFFEPMITPKLVILGAGGYANTVKDVAEQLGYEIVVMLDDKLEGKSLNTFINYVADDVFFIPAFGNNEFRLSWIDKISSFPGAKLATLIHPISYVSPKAKIEQGCVILPHATVNTGTIVEKGCIVNIGSIIDHDCLLEPGVHIAPGAIVKGENRIKSCMKIESGQVIEARKYSL